MNPYYTHPLNLRKLFQDPRYYQIGWLSLLLIFGLAVLKFPVEINTVILTIATALLTQWILTQWAGLGHFETKSALISSLSICLLLRADSDYFFILASVIAISSKFFLRVQNRHVFNPANFALVLLTLLFDSVWLSSGQWGQSTWLALFVSGLGLLVIIRSRRTDITLAFLAFYAFLLFGRAIWLGDPLTIPIHQLFSGALLIFAFFMISDPVTSPNSRVGRIIFAACVTLGAGFVQFVLYKPNGVFYSLILACLFTPLINRWFPGKSFRWC